MEPELAADTAQSITEGVLARWTRTDRARTMADGLRSEPSELTFAHLREVLDGMLTVSEEQIGTTVAALATKARIVAEPSGAVAPAAYLHHRDELPDGPAVAVVSGGNIDPALLLRLLST